MAAVWIGFVAAFLLFLLLSYSTIRYYADPMTMHTLPTTVVMFSLLFSLICVLMVPVDVYVTSLEPSQTEFVMQLYFIFFAALTVLAFIVIPFAYFFSEDYIQDEADKETCLQRTMTSVKYTSFSAAIVVVIILVGLLLEPGADVKITNQQELVQWVNNLLDMHSGPGTRALLLITSCLFTIGLCNFALYTACGMFSFPLMLIRGTRGSQQKLKFDFDQIRIRQRKVQIQQKYSQYEQLGRKDLRELSDLNRQEKLLRRQNDSANSDKSWSNVLWNIIAPFRVTLGVFLMCISFVLVYSIVVTLIDKAIHSECGVSCGFIVDQPRLYNPFDQMLVLLSKSFPVDYATLCTAALYFYVVSLYGIFRVGVRVFGVQVYKIEKGNTWPQALIMCALLMMLLILSLSFEMMILAPQYTTFGSQTHIDTRTGLQIPCVMLQSKDVCRISQIAGISTQIAVTMPVFSLIFYAGNWLFIAVSVTLLIREAVRGKKDGSEEGDDDDLDPDDFELARLLGTSAIRRR